MNYQIEALHQWLIVNSIQHTFLEERVFMCEDKRYLLILHKKQKVFNPNMSLILEDNDLDMLDKHPIDYFVILFGDKYYYFSEEDLNTVAIHDEVGDVVGEDMRVKQIHLLVYIGKAVYQENFPHLGVHGGYDLCNGSRSYKDWCKKAKWLELQTLGICEENTLAGTLLFQNACKDAKLNSIIGETITIQYDNLVQYHIKLYCMSDIGWTNLLQINALLNI
jgi:DNA polymerase-3 subunit alpha